MKILGHYVVISKRLVLDFELFKNNLKFYIDTISIFDFFCFKLFLIIAIFFLSESF